VSFDDVSFISGEDADRLIDWLIGIVLWHYLVFRHAHTFTMQLLLSDKRYFSMGFLLVFYSNRMALKCIVVELGDMEQTDRWTYRSHSRL